MELDFRKDPRILSTVVDEMSSGVFTVDAEGRFVAWSAGAERITGYTASDVLGKPCRLLEGPTCKGFSTLAELLADPDPQLPGVCNQECKLRARDGRELYIYGSVRLVRDETGSVVGAVGAFTDMTPFVLANEKITLLQEQIRPRGALDKLIGHSEPMQEVFRRLRLAAQSDVTVLLTGESGTGKELAAGAIHSLGARSSQPFLAVNCSAIPETLLESELFGHVKGAFTGAVRDKLGVFQAAEGGTLFLDEIGDISQLLQLKLLRVIQEREIRRVGDDRATRVDVRLITATHRDLKQLVQTGQMREDFYYRINVFPVTLPPLRERREDIPLLIDYFLQTLPAARGRGVTGIAKDALVRLMDYSWPGNIRQLRNAVEHALVTVTGDRITLLDLPPEIRDLRHPLAPVPTAVPSAERTELIDALQQTHGNRTEAARLLGVSRVTLWKRMRKWGL